MFGSTTPSNNKPAFGTGTTGGSLFGAGSSNTTTGAFGTGATTGFGASTGGFGQNQQSQNQGTAVAQFTAHQEKDSTSNSNSHYQTITFQQPYQGFSLEELRLADYNAGRRYGNSNGQAGAFGASTGFGGFGATTGTSTGAFGQTNTNTGGGFGAQTQTSSPFGQNQAQTTTSGFGFGQNKPATGGLFGNSTTTTAGQTGGLFGTTNAGGTSTGGAFGGFGSGNTTTGGSSLFGAQNQTQNQTQAKPAFGGFGTSTTGGFGASTSGGFGQQQGTANTGSLFGGGNNTNTTTNSSPFGNNQPAQTTGGNAFGGFGQNQQNQNQTQNQGTTGGSLFGGFGQNTQTQNQQKPGGLFGNSTSATGGGLFGNNQNQQTQSSGGLFGSNNQGAQQTSSLFGQKPATSTPSLFGNNQNQSTPAQTSGLFGGNSGTQNQGGSLFGNNQQKPGGLFGGSTNAGGGSGLFGGLNQNNQNQGGNSIFGNSTNNQNAGGSLFGNSQQNQQQQQQQPLMASLMQNPYGNDQLFANLGTPPPAVGPLATPLSGAQKPAKRPQMLPAFKINPSQSMRLITPQKRANGYGFSYSTYGTPGSAQGFTPGRNSLLGSGGAGRSLSKSLSTSNLRTSLSAEDSVLAPGAFTPNARPYSSGSSSIRRLKIDRTLRTDLFGNDGMADRPSKRVSFDGAGVNGVKDKQTNGDSASASNNSLVRTETDGPEPSSEELGLLRAPRHQSKDSRTNGAPSRPEMEQVRGNELAVVPEDEQAPATETRSAPNRKPVRAQTDQEPGEYYMSPSMRDLRDMPRNQLKNVSPFTVGRYGIGRIEFDAVDLTAVSLDEIMGDIVKLNVRSATVYETGVNTPPEGKGLNVPSTITLENSWPRSDGGRLPVHERKGTRYEKHIERLRRVGGTEFISYNAETGEWLFRVQHFTTYALDDDDDETMADNTAVGGGQTTPTPQATPTVQPSEDTGVSADASMMSPEHSDPDDTFDFKKGKKKTLPGGFGDESVIYDDDMDEDVAHEDEGSDIDRSGAGLEDPFVDDSRALMSPPETDNEADHEMAGAFPQSGVNMPKSILKGAVLGGTPPRATFELNDDWAEQLQRTLSPKKQDRRALRGQQNALFENGGVPTASIMKASTTAGAFNTTMDIMNSLWAQPKNASVRGRGNAPGGKGFEV